MPDSAYDVVFDNSGNPIGKKLKKGVVQNQGLVGNIISGVTDPFSRLLRGATTQLSKIAGNNQNFLNQEETSNYNNPLNVIKDVANAGSNFIPFGTAAKGAGLAAKALAAAKTGAKIGAAQGFGSTYGKDSFEDTLEGTLTGAAGGGLVGGFMPIAGAGIGKIANKFRPTNKVNNVGGAKGKFGYTFNPKSGEDEASAFAKYVTDEAPKGQNWLQKKGRQGVAKQLGATTRKGELDFTGKLEKDLNIMDSSLDFYDLPRNAEGMSQLPGKIGDLRQKTLQGSNKTFDINLDKFATSDEIDFIRRNTKNGANLSEEQVKNSFTSALKESLPADKFGRDINSLISGKAKLNTLDLQDVKNSTSKAYQKLIKKGAGEMTPDEVAQARLWQWANGELRTGVKGYGKVNDVFETLYTQNQGFRQAYDTGLGGTRIASPQDAKSAAMNFVGGKFNSAVEKAGDLVAGNKGKFSLPKSQGVSQNLEKLSNFLSADGMPQTRIAQIIGAQAMLEMYDADGDGQVSEEEALNASALNTDIPVSPEIDDMKSRYDQAFEGYLQMSGDPIKARKEASALTGYDPSDQDSSLTSKQKEQLSTVNSTEQRIESLLSEIDDYASPLPGVGNILAMNPFDSKRKGFDLKIKALNKELASAMEGRSPTDADMKYYLTFLPNQGDTADTMKEKFNAIKEMLGMKRNELQTV